MQYDDPLTMYRLISEAYGEYLNDCHGLPLKHNPKLHQLVQEFCHGLDTLHDKTEVSVNIHTSDTIYILFESVRYRVTRKALVVLHAKGSVPSSISCYRSNRKARCLYGEFQSRHTFECFQDVLNIGKILKGIDL